MIDEFTPGPLIWISGRYAVNPANISHVFRGTRGEIEIEFIGGRPLKVSAHDLTTDGQALLLPGERDAHELKLEPSVS